MRRNDALVIADEGILMDFEVHAFRSRGGEESSDFGVGAIGEEPMVEFFLIFEGELEEAGIGAWFGVHGGGCLGKLA